MKTPLLLCTLLGCLSATISAVTRTWDGGDTANNNWNDPQNWNPDTAPAANDLLVFPVGSPAIPAADKTMSNNYPAATDWLGLQFTATGYSVAGNAFDLGASGLSLNISGTGTAVITPAVTLLVSHAWDTVTADDTLTLNGGVNLNGQTLTVTGAGLTILNGGVNGSASSSIVVNVTGGGLRIPNSGSFTFTGPITVQEGVLEIGNGFEFPSVTIEPGGILGGDGHFTNITGSGGTIQPGRVAGAATDTRDSIVVEGGLVCSAGTTFVMDVVNSMDSGHDRIRTNGNASIDLGGATLTVNAASFAGAPGDRFTIVDQNLPGAGTFAGLPEGSAFVANGRSFSITYRGGDGNDVVLTHFIPATGVTKTWAGAGTNGNWGQSANWSGGVAPLAGDDVVFPAGVPAAGQDNDPNYGAGGRNFNTVTFQDGGYATAGGTIQLNAGLTASHTSGVVTWDSTLRLTRPQTFSFTGETTFNSNVILNGSTLTIASSAPLVTFNDVMNAAGSIIIDGTGPVRFSGVNNFTGPCTITRGVLQLDSATALGTTAQGTVIGENGQLVIFSNATGIAENITLAGDIVQSATTGEITGSITTQSTAGRTARIQCDASSVLTLSGALNAEAGSVSTLRKTGPGELMLTGIETGNLSSLLHEEGTLRLAKSPGAAAVMGGITVGTDNIGPAALVLVQQPNQMHPGGVFHVRRSGTVDFGSVSDMYHWVEMTGGRIQGTGTLSLMFGVQTHAAATPASLAIPLNCGTNMGLQVEDGSAVPDLFVNQPVTPYPPGMPPPGDKVRVHGGGHVMFLTALPPVTIVGTSTVEVGMSTPGGAVTLEGGRLKGAGSAGSITSSFVGGTVAPGASAGILTSGAVSWNAATTLEVELLNGTPGTGHDQLSVTGTVSLGDAALNVATLAGYTGDVGTQFVIIANDSTEAVTGTFASLPAGSTVDVGNVKFSISYTGGTGNDVVLTVVRMGATGITRTWDGGGVNNAWSLAANWQGDVAPVAGDALVFPFAAARLANTNNFPAGTTFDSITVQAAGYSLSGNPIHLNAGLSADFPSVTSIFAAFTLAMPVTLTGAQTFLMANQGIFEYAPGPGLNTNGHILTCHTAAAGSIMWLRPTVSGAGGLTKTGPGELVLEGNSYTGLTTIAEGRLSIANPASLGTAAGGTTVAAGAELRLTDAQTSFTLAENISLSGTLRIGSIPQSFTGNFDLPAGATGTFSSLGGGTLVLTGVIAGAGALRITGTAQLSGAASNTFTGGCTVAQGSLILTRTGGAVALRGPVTIGGLGLSSQLALNAPNQLLNTAIVTLADASANYFSAGASQTIAHLDMTGGTVTTSAGPLTINGTLTTHPSATSATLAGEIRLPSGEHAWTVADGTVAIDLRVNGMVTSTTAGVLVKQGAGRADFQSATTGLHAAVAGGRANFNGASTGTNVQLRGGTVGGTGTVAAITSNGAPGSALAPGLSPGILTSASTVLNNSASLEAELNGPAAGTEYDQHRCGGAVVLNGMTLNVSLGFAPAIGSSFTIVDNTGAGGIAGTFAGLPEGAKFTEPGAQVFQITYTGGDGNDVVLTRVAVPDPVITSSSVVPGTSQVFINASATGTPGLTYFLDSSTDLAAWTVLESATASPGGLLSFNRILLYSPPRLYLRIRLP